VRECEIVVVGGGPAGLTAAREAGVHGAEVLVLDRNDRAGGQLVKQTHRFFGSRAQRAGVRGIDIADVLLESALDCQRVDISLNSDVMGFYPDGAVAYEKEGTWNKIHPKCLIVTTGAAEKFIAFPGCDLPGVYGAGAVQTLMNVHGVRPGKKVLMVGAGNIGLIVSYQLMQAGVDVLAIIEALPEVGGYTVHASKVRRMGVPILTGHTVTCAHGEDHVQGATVVQLDESWNPIEGTESDVECDAICLAVGLSPLIDLLWQAGCSMGFVPELGGYVPMCDENMRTSAPGVYVAGDARGIEEASAAMMEGSLAGLGSAHALDYVSEEDYSRRHAEISSELQTLRSGPTARHILDGFGKLQQVSPRTQRLTEGSEDTC